MNKGKDIRQALANLKHYATKVDESARAQFNEDFEIARKLGINFEHGSKRFDALGAIINAANWLGIWCSNIEVNLGHAESEDKLLRLTEEEESEDGNEPEPLYGGKLF